MHDCGRLTYLIQIKTIQIMIIKYIVPCINLIRMPLLMYGLGIYDWIVSGSDSFV